MKALSRRPSARLVRILIAFLALALLGSIWTLFDPPTTHIRYFTQTWSALLLVLLGISVLDARSVRGVPDISIRRILPNTLSLHAWAEVHLEFEHQFTRARSIKVFDDHPIGAQSTGLPIEIRLERGLTSRASYRLRPMTRGDAHFHSAHVHSYSPLGLWKVASRSGGETAVRVYPNFAAVSRYSLIATDHHTAQVGIKLRPRRGEGLEFHQLREYRLGDSMRQVDWKATARKNQLISKEYQDERDQQILFLVDCGIAPPAVDLL